MSARHNKWAQNEWGRQIARERAGYLDYSTTDFTPKPKPTTRWQRFKAIFTRKRKR